MYAAHAASSQQDNLWTMRCHPFFDFGLTSEIQRHSGWIEQQLASFVPEPAHYGTADHAVLTSDPDKLIGQIEEHG
jgi:hypothetical protein